ncbi:MAG: hypothetical protein ACREQ3_27790, partial [Candidatus Binatia bacterium]
GGTSWTSIINKTDNDGAQNWKVTGPATSQAQIRISSINSPTMFDTSDGNFTIGGSPPPPTVNIMVVAPNGGEQWAIGSKQKIKWTSSGVSGNVKIEVSRNGGASWILLFSSTANDGTENWKVTGPATAQAQIRVSSVSNPSVVDTSNGNFTIK